MQALLVSSDVNQVLLGAISCLISTCFLVEMFLFCQVFPNPLRLYKCSTLLMKWVCTFPNGFHCYKITILKIILL